jgi:citrate lyase subunit beta/citryl-CoA lyase
VPGSNPERIAKAAASAADGVILDLEDAVAVGQKASAREWVVAALRRVAFGGRERLVRINALASAFGLADLAAVAAVSPDGVLVPKVAGEADVRAVDAALGRAEAAAGLPPGRIRLHLLVETVPALLAVEPIAAASTRTVALYYGAGDLARETRWRLLPGRLPELHAMGRIVLAARAAGLDAIDSPCFDIEHPESIDAHTRTGAELGFDGKAVIHPRQIEPANRHYTPSVEAVTEAERVLDAYERARSGGSGALAIDGRFVDAVHVEMARTVLARARLAREG